MKKIIAFSLMCSFGIRAMKESPRKPLERLSARGPMFINHKYSFAEGSKTPHVYHAYQPDYVHLQLVPTVIVRNVLTVINDIDNMREEVKKGSRIVEQQPAHASLARAYFFVSLMDRQYVFTEGKERDLLASKNLLDSKKRRVKREIAKAFKILGKL
ncbi:MAG: hypothetical protein WC707_00475 [Candidatus Babeliaceae bacterium]|jgi:hypothetical protein